MSAAIEVLELKRLAGDGNLKGFVKIRVGAFVIHGVRIIQQPNQKPWIALPQTPGRRKADGSGSGWFPVLECTSADLMARIKDAVIQVWERGQ